MSKFNELKQKNIKEDVSIILEKLSILRSNNDFLSYKSLSTSLSNLINIFSHLDTKEIKEGSYTINPYGLDKYKYIILQDDTFNFYGELIYKLETEISELYSESKKYLDTENLSEYNELISSFEKFTEVYAKLNEEYSNTKYILERINKVS